MDKLFSLGLLLSGAFLAQSTVAQEKIGVDVQNCQVILINDPVLFATKPGKLVIAPEEGMRVNKGEMIAQIDDTESRLGYEEALLRLEAAQMAAENDVDVRYAEAQEKVTQAEVDEAVEANKRAPGAISESQVRRRKFQHERSGLATEQARLEFKKTDLEAKIALATAKKAKHDLETRQLTSEITGVVSERLKQVGEWAREGDPIARLMQLDEIRVLGYVPADRIARNEVIGKPVLIDVHLTGNRVERIKAKIDHAGFEVDQAGTYKVWADIKNIDDGGDFAIHPGCTARMIIDVDGRLGLNAGGPTFISAPGSQPTTNK